MMKSISLTTLFFVLTALIMHGGGILVYVKSSLRVTPIQSPNTNLVPLSHHRSFSIATFYRPPSSPHDLDLLISSFSKLNLSILLNLI